MALYGFVSLCLLLGSAVPPPAFSGGFPVTRRDQIYPLSALKVGDRGIGYTVFSGAEVKPFNVEILGVLESMIGPGEDVIMARLTGPEIEFTGVIAGMSGSPVYIDGKLLGAVSYRFGVFTKEAIAGITPISNMLANEGERVDAPPAHARAAGPASPSRGVDVRQFRSRELQPLAMPVARGDAGRAGARPIETPLSISGLDPDSLASLASDLEPYGLRAVAGGGRAGRSAPGPRKTEPNSESVAGLVKAPPIAPAAPIAALLMRGDVNVAAIGTVTMVEGNKIWAFGHPFLGSGHVELPMATASIINTLASEAGSYKQGAPSREVGTITHDRLTAIAGTLGKAAPMLPVAVRVRRPGPASGEPLLSSRVEIVDSPDWMPVMLEAIIASTAARRIGYEPGGTVDMTARMWVGDRVLEIVDSYAAPPPFRVSAFAARDLANLAQIIGSNEITPASVSKVEVDLVCVSEVHMATLEAIQPERTRVRRGERLGVLATIKPYRGPSRQVRLELPIPADAEDKLEIYVGGGIELDRRDAEVYSERYPTDLDELLGILSERRPGRAIHARVYQSRPGLRVDATLLPSLPPSQKAAIESRSGRTSHVLSESFGPATSVPLDEVLLGGMAVSIVVSR